MRVEDDGELLEGSYDIQCFWFLATGHANKPFIFDQLQQMIEIILCNGFFLSNLGVDGDQFGEVVVGIRLVFFNL